MKKIIIGCLVILMFIGMTHVVYAASCNIQDGVIIIDIFSDGKVASLNCIKQVFASYDSPAFYNSVSDRYELRFEFVNQPLKIVSAAEVLSINTPPANIKPLLIDGLYLEGFNVSSPLLQINYPWAEVALENNIFINVTNAVDIVKTKVKFYNNMIGGDGLGACLHIDGGEGHIIKESDFSGCNYGIWLHDTLNTQIYDNEIQLCTNDGIRLDLTKETQIGNNLWNDGRNHIHNNKIGIDVIQSKTYKHGFNENYGNTQSAIVIDDLSDKPLPPEVEMYEKDGQQYLMKCTKDESGKIVKREIKFNNPVGEIEVYGVEDDTLGQAKIFLYNFTLGSTGIADVSGLVEALPPAYQDLLQTQCGLSDYYITAIYTGSNSSELMERKALSGYVILTSGVISQPTPSSEGHLSGESGTAVEGGATGSDVPVTIVGSGGEAGGGLALAPGGCGGGAQLIPYNGSNKLAIFIGLWWIIVSLSLVIGARILRQKAIIRNHRH